MNDRPSLRRRHLCNQLSAIVAKLEQLGCTPEQADRIVVAAATDRVNAAYGLTAGAANSLPALPMDGLVSPIHRAALGREARYTVQEPDWHDGRWTVLEPELDTF